MGEVIELATAYIILCQPDEGNATAEELRAIGKRVSELGPSVSLLRGSWLLSTIKEPHQITKELSDVNRKFVYMASRIKKHISVEETFSQYGDYGRIRKWLEQHLV